MRQLESEFHLSVNGIRPRATLPSYRCGPPVSGQFDSPIL